MRSRPAAPPSPPAAPAAASPFARCAPIGARSTRAALVLVVGLALGLAAALASCRATPIVDPLGRIPALLIEGPALLRWLDRASALSDTPVGRRMARLRNRLADCPEIALGPSDPSLDALGCRDALELPAPLVERLETARGEHAGILQWPVGGAGRIELRFDVDAAGGLALTGRLEPDDAMGPAGFLVPAAEPPAAPRIDAARALVHLHLRSASGTGLAALVPEDSQGDRLFALKGRLLEGALLEGTLELAFVEPAPPQGQVPLAVLALHHRGAAPIRAALGEALSRLERTWSIVPSARQFTAAGGAAIEGGCYAELPLLPELAPCWVVTEEALFVGYRAEAIEAVLSGGAPASQASGLVVDFERMRDLDRRLVVGRSDASADPAAPRLSDLYTRLELRGAAGPDGAIDLHGSLEARP